MTIVEKATIHCSYHNIMKYKNYYKKKKKNSDPVLVFFFAPVLKASYNCAQHTESFLHS